MDKQRVLIAGARGFLGLYAVEAASADGEYTVLGASRNTAGLPLDIADSASVARVFDQVRPDLVLLLAAIADIDRCERFPQEAFAINVQGAENVANACARTNARLLFTSTAAVFDGKHHGYREEDPVSPLSVYGKTKVQAETVVSQLTPSAAIVRFSLAIGLAKDPRQPGMIDSMGAKLKAGETLYLSTRERRNPLHAATLCSQMMRLLADPQAGGIYHAGTSDSMSRYELGQKLAHRLRVPFAQVQPKDDPAPGRAPRGEDHFLRTERIQQLYDLELETCDQAIERCFA